MQKIRYFFISISNLIYYFNVIWKNKDWDHEYFDAIVYKKLKKVYKRYSNNEYFVGQEETVKQLRICIKLFDMLRENYYTNVWYKNQNRISTETCCKCEIDKYNTIYKIIGKYGQTWWD